MFRIKVCGVTIPADAAHAVACGADAIGLNFYAKSPRRVPPDAAAAVARAASGALVVGVFVNAGAEEIARLVESVPLGAIQLHGDEPAGFVGLLPAGVPVVRALRMGSDGLSPAATAIAAAHGLGRPLAAVLIDAAGAPGEYGGTGRTTDWGRIAAERGAAGGVPLILAGGLNPENVAEAVRASCAAGVDTASGVESSPGVKDPDAVRRFVASARGALAGG